MSSAHTKAMQRIVRYLRAHYAKGSSFTPEQIKEAIHATRVLQVNVAQVMKWIAGQEPSSAYAPLEKEELPETTWEKEMANKQSGLTEIAKQLLDKGETKLAKEVLALVSHCPNCGSTHIGRKPYGWICWDCDHGWEEIEGEVKLEFADEYHSLVDKLQDEVFTAGEFLKGNISREEFHSRIKQIMEASINGSAISPSKAEIEKEMRDALEDYKKRQASRFELVEQPDPQTEVFDSLRSAMNRAEDLLLSEVQIEKLERKDKKWYLTYQPTNF